MMENVKFEILEKWKDVFVILVLLVFQIEMMSAVIVINFKSTMYYT